MPKDHHQFQRQKTGDVGEQIAERVMRSLGILLVEKIETPSIVVNGHKVYTGKVSGDRRGVLPPNGLSVHAEVKSRKSKNLPYSALEDHQRDWLTRHAETGAISLLIWITPYDVFVMKWGVNGILGYMKPRSSITPEMARKLNIDRLDNGKQKKLTDGADCVRKKVI